MEKFTHFDEQGHAHMVDVSDKQETLREAVATGIVEAQLTTLQRIIDNGIGKGDVLGVARLAGIMAAKKTSDLIPLCHPLPLSSVALELQVKSNHVFIRASVKTTGRTGVEMEALTAVTVAALTVYDMCKAVDRGMVIRDVQLVRKTGGKSGTFIRGKDNL